MYFNLETAVRVLFTNNARAKCTMNEKFSILNEAAGGPVQTCFLISLINFVFILLFVQNLKTF